MIEILASIKKFQHEERSVMDENIIVDDIVIIEKEISKVKKKTYWTDVQEDAVKEYLRLPAESPQSEKIFVDHIYGPLKKLIENIMFTYRLSLSDVSIDEQVMDTMSFVTYKMRKYDPEKGCKAFSYYGTIAKNYMLAQRTKKYNNKIKTVDIEDVLGFEFDQGLFEDNEFEKDTNSYQFLFTLVADELEIMIETNLTLDPNVYKVSGIVIYLLRNYQVINVHNKRQFYLLAREYTGLSAKEITKALVKIKESFSKTNKSFI